MTKFAAILTLLAATVGLTGCSDNEGGPDIEPVTYNIVTYRGMNEGEHPQALFEYQVIDDSPLIQLTANVCPDETYKPPLRMMLAYKTATPGESGPVEVLQISPIVNGMLTIPDNGEIPASEGIKVISMWRTGYYLNLIADVYATGNLMQADLLMPPGSYSEKEVTASVVINGTNDSLSDGPPRRLYASWFIGLLWLADEELQTLRVSYTDPSGAIRSIDFKKETNY